jgi:hypothetical protein
MQCPSTPLWYIVVCQESGDFWSLQLQTPTVDDDNELAEYSPCGVADAAGTAHGRGNSLEKS